jgi:hypothetical protein
MTQVYFHCSHPRGVLLDGLSIAVDDLAQARDRAACVVHSLTRTHSAEDWRNWILHVNDDLGDELFIWAVRARARKAALKARQNDVP